MIAYPRMLVEAAVQAGMKVPENPDHFDKWEFSHFEVFIKAQIGKKTNYPGEHWDNAHIIAGFTEEAIRTVTMPELVKKGFIY